MRCPSDRWRALRRFVTDLIHLERGWTAPHPQSQYDALSKIDAKMRELSRGRR